MNEDGTDDHLLTSHKSYKLLCSLVQTELSYPVSWHTCNVPYNPKGLPSRYMPEASHHYNKNLALSF